MTVQDKNTLKGYFANGKVPDETKYEDLIDTMSVDSAISASVADGWIRIADGIGSHNAALFRVIASKGGSHTSMVFSASITFGASPRITVLSNSKFGVNGNIGSVRIVYAGTYDVPYLEVDVDGAATIHVQMLGSYGWSLITPIGGSIPGGYTSYTLVISGLAGPNASTAELADAAPWTGITGKPSTFPPSTHTHPGTDVTSIVGDSSKLAGALPSVSASGSTIVQRHSSGYIFANYFNMTADTRTDQPAKIAGMWFSDNYLRYVDPLNVLTKGRFVPLIAPAGSTNWDGDYKSAVSFSLVDLSSEFGLPAGITAISLRLMVRDSLSANGSDSYVQLSSAGSGNPALICRCGGLPNNYWSEQAGIVPCTTGGDVYVTVSKYGNLQAWWQITGYWI